MATTLVTSQDVASYILGEGLLLPSDVVDHDVRIRDVSRRNRNFKVETSYGGGYFLKQGGDTLSGLTVQNEAHFYNFVLEDATGRSIIDLLPVFRSYDVARGILVTEWLQSSVSLRHRGPQRPLAASTRSAAMLGTALGTLHRIPYLSDSNLIGLKEEEIVLRHLISIFSIHRPSANILREASGGQLQLVRMIQHLPEFGRRLDDLCLQWKAEAVIHSDLKWDNLLLVTENGGTIGSSLKIVDWELATVGDPSWDIATVLGEYLTLWVLSMPEYGHASVKSATVSLSSLQPAIRSFLRAYFRASSNSACATLRLRRGIEFVAPRLLQTVFEHSKTSSRLTRNDMFLVQLSFNIIQDTDSVARNLLGLDDSWEAILP